MFLDVDQKITPKFNRMFLIPSLLQKNYMNIHPLLSILLTDKQTNKMNSFPL